jgi:cysteine desulfurase / selenocysteine lyase
MDSLIWSQFREAMPITKRWAYLDHAAVAPLPQPAVEAITSWARLVSQEGDTIWPQWRQQLEQLRQRLAHLLGASAAEIALVANTTTGVDLVAQALPWKSGDNLVTLANEFPSNVYPWLALEPAGVTIRRIDTPRGRVDIQRLADACDARTRLVAISWVGYASGWRVDLDELATMVHERGALLFLDAIQGLGIFPLNLRHTPVDFLAADGHKWMLGPEGAGVLYIRQEHLPHLRLRAPGWNSVQDPFAFEQTTGLWRPDAARYEGGSHNLAGLLAWDASLQLLAASGWTAEQNGLTDRVLELADYAAESLVQRGATLLFDRTERHRSAIVTFTWPNVAPQELRRRCRAAGVAVSVRGGGLRISPHAYNQPHEIDRLIDALS